MTNHQRKGATSNAHAGRAFEKLAQKYLESREGLSLDTNYELGIGVSKVKKTHKFDLGSDNPQVIVECKSHTWTETDNIPSAKMTTWNQAMYYFEIAPNTYRKILFVLKVYSKKREETLAEHYLRIYPHLIPAGVEIWEYSEKSRRARKLN